MGPQGTKSFCENFLKISECSLQVLDYGSFFFISKFCLILNCLFLDFTGNNEIMVEGCRCFASAMAENKSVLELDISFYFFFFAFFFWGVLCINLFMERRKYGFLGIQAILFICLFEFNFEEIEFSKFLLFLFCFFLKIDN